MRWLRSALPELAGRLLLEGLEAACLTSGAARGWITILTAGQRHDLLACLGTSGPGRLTLVGRIPAQPSKLSGPALESLCPFREPVLARVFPMGKGALFLEGNTVPPARLLEKVHLALERIEIEREAEGLRARVQRLGEELQRARTAPEVAVSRRPEALRSWYSHAAGTLASSQLASALPALAQRAGSLLETDFAALLVMEDKRVRLWGGDLLRKELGPVFSARKLGSLGRRVLEDGESFVSSQDPGRLGRNRLLSQLGIKNLLMVPLQVDDRLLGALMLGGMSQRDFLPEELDLARLMAYQSALFLENALLVSGADVERVVARAVLDSMADGVYTLDWEKRITSFNPAAESITGWPAEKAIGRTCEEVIRAQYLCPGGGSYDEPRQPGSCRDSCPLLAMLADQKLMDSGLTVEGTILTNDGESRYVSSTYSVVADKGDLLGAVVLFRDITEKKAIEQMKSDYAAALSHDLKTPLTAMKGYAITLLRHSAKLDEETRRDALEVINSEIDRVTRMFDNLLHQARMEAGQQARYIEPVPLVQAVKRVITVHSASSRRHKLSHEVPDDLIIRADRDQLDQILNNLVSNAVKYSPGGCNIRVAARPDGRQAYIEVIDDGSGIPADQLSIVFERFRRVQDRMSRKVSGSGLGLYITRMLVEGMEGECGVESEVGKGSTFWFRLPLERAGVTAS